MKDLSLTQEHMICTVNEKGDLPGYNQKAVACLIVSGLLEMQMTKRLVSAPSHQSIWHI